MTEEEFKKIIREDYKISNFRISAPMNMKFLIIGKPKTSNAYINGEYTEFEYLEENVIANGHTFEQLLESFQYYLRVSDMTMKQFLEHEMRML